MKNRIILDQRAGQKTIALMGMMVALVFAAVSNKVMAAPEIKSQLTGYLVLLNEEGKEIFTPAEQAEPGVVIEYRMQFENLGDRAAKDLSVVGPIPANTRYQGGTAHTAVRSDLQVSIDNGDNWEAEPVIRERILEDGTKEQYVIPPEQYTHLRWKSRERLGAGEVHEYRYRVIVD